MTGSHFFRLGKFIRVSCAASPTNANVQNGEKHGFQGKKSVCIMFVAARFIGPKLPLEESIRSNLILQKYSRNKKSWMKGLAHVEYLLSQKL